ncbi:MAG: DUF3365 domain-containing protein [Vicingaceae bacterium]
MKIYSLNKLALGTMFLALVAIILQACVSEAKAEALALMQNKCYSCHHPTSAEDSRLAPPLFAVKKHYTKKYETKEVFVAAMKSFLNQPTEEKALMKGAIKKFGLMAAMQFPEAEIEVIANYMYENELPKPEWFDEHHKQKHGKGKKHGKEKHKKESETAEKSPLAKGKAMALKTKAALGKNLMQAINQRGAAGAVEFCNLKALPITDSLAQMQNASIKRVSDQNRNPLNKANEAELAYIKEAKARIEQGKQNKPQIKQVDGKWVGYYPIMTNSMCLQCHGKAGEQIDPTTLAKIEEKYPEDKATGYSENQLRGIWVVEFEE